MLHEIEFFNASKPIPERLARECVGGGGERFQFKFNWF